MTIPGADRAFVHPDKIRAYLLSGEHREGRSKARAFAAAGFCAHDALLLSEQLAQLAQTGTARPGASSPFGQKYEIDGILKSPTGSRFGVRTIWIIRFDEDFPRFVTAYPRRQR